MRHTPEVVSANVEVGHHAIVDGQEGKVAPPWRLHHAEHIQRSRAALTDCVRGRLQQIETVYIGAISSMQCG